MTTCNVVIVVPGLGGSQLKLDQLRIYPPSIKEALTGSLDQKKIIALDSDVEGVVNDAFVVDDKGSLSKLTADAVLMKYKGHSVYDKLEHGLRWAGFKPIAELLFAEKDKKTKKMRPALSGGRVSRFYTFFPWNWLLSLDKAVEDMDAFIDRIMAAAVEAATGTIVTIDVTLVAHSAGAEVCEMFASLGRHGDAVRKIIAVEPATVRCNETRTLLMEGKFPSYQILGFSQAQLWELINRPECRVLYQLLPLDVLERWLDMVHAPQIDQRRATAAVQLLREARAHFRGDVERVVLVRHCDSTHTLPTNARIIFVDSNKSHASVLTDPRIVSLIMAELPLDDDNDDDAGGRD